MTFFFFFQNRLIPTSRNSFLRESLPKVVVGQGCLRDIASAVGIATGILCRCFVNGSLQKSSASNNSWKLSYSYSSTVACKASSYTSNEYLKGESSMIIHLWFDASELVRHRLFILGYTWPYILAWKVHLYSSLLFLEETHRHAHVILYSHVLIVTSWHQSLHQCLFCHLVDSSAVPWILYV